jgi:hypothetical protein
MTPELRVREYERFKACYCGLCRELGRKYGAAARMILNFDFVFLAMLLWDEGETPVIERRRCAVSLCRKKACCAENGALGVCAGYSVILAWYKLRDSVRDGGFFKAAAARGAMVALRRAYRRSAREYPEFDALVREKLAELTALERAGEASLDRAADSFARLLAGAAAAFDGGRRRAAEQLLYHTGRWIYILDACDDLTEDAAARRYNPVARRFAVEGAALGGEARERLKTTLTHSLNLAASAYALLPENAWGEVTQNILYLGLPGVTDAVLDGKWRTPRPGLPK